MLNLLGQYLTHTSERGGVFRDYEKGISLGWTGVQPRDLCGPQDFSGPIAVCIR